MKARRGAATVPSPAECRSRLQRYFDRSTFEQWDDLAPPLIRIPPDGRMVYMIVEKSVRPRPPTDRAMP